MDIFCSGIFWLYFMNSTVFVFFFFSKQGPLIQLPTFHSFPCSLLLSLLCFFFPPSAVFSQMQRLSYLKPEPPCVLSWLSSCLKGDEVAPFPYLPGICQRTRLLVLVIVKGFFFPKYIFHHLLLLLCFGKCDLRILLHWIVLQIDLISLN